MNKYLYLIQELNDPELVTTIRTDNLQLFLNLPQEKVTKSKSKYVIFLTCLYLFNSIQILHYLEHNPDYDKDFDINDSVIKNNEPFDSFSKNAYDSCVLTELYGNRKYDSIQNLFKDPNFLPLKQYRNGTMFFEKSDIEESDKIFYEDQVGKKLPRVQIHVNLIGMLDERIRNILCAHNRCNYLDVTLPCLSYLSNDDILFELQELYSLADVFFKKFQDQINSRTVCLKISHRASVRAGYFERAYSFDVIQKQFKRFAENIESDIANYISQYYQDQSTINMNNLFSLRNIIKNTSRLFDLYCTEL